MTSVTGTNSVMAMRNAILQKNQALRDIAGTGMDKVGGVGAAGITGGAQGTQATDFGSAMSNALQEVNNLQSKAGEAATAFERGETTDIAQVMLAKQQASISFEATLQVRNKLLSAYKEIMSMPV